MTLKKTIFGIILLAALAAVYLIGSRNIKSTSDNTEQVSQNQEENILIDTSSSDISKIIITRRNDVFEIINATPEDSEENIWKTADVSENSLDQDTMEMIVSSAAKLHYSEKIESADVSEYGLDNPDTVVNSYYKDGSEKTIKFGSPSVDGNYYYSMIEGDSGIYMTESLAFRRFNYTLDDVIFKDIEKISPAQIIYLDIKYSDNEEIEIEYDEEKDGSAQTLAQYGMQTLTMKKPLSDTAVYPNNLQSYVLTSVTSLALSDLIDANPEDYSKYGLDNPRMDITLKDTSNSLRLRIGNDIDNGYSYCAVDDRKEVFSIENSLIESFENVDILSITERFISLVYRVDVESISLRDSSDNYEITFVREDDTEPETNEDGTKNLKDTRTPYINGKKCEEETFANIYQLITGLTFDNIAETDISSQPEISIRYDMIDGTAKEINLRSYNDNFYSVELDGENLNRLVNKQSVKTMLNSLMQQS